MAYLYRHIRKDKNEPFYIGIGKVPNRIDSIQYRNKHWHNIVNKCGFISEIIIDDLTWEQAKEKEKEFILLYGRIDKGTGILCNMTDGGDGGSGVVVSDETRKKRSEIAKKRVISKETREKMANALRGRVLPEWQKEILSKAKLGKSTPWCHVKIVQLDLFGVLIREWDSITEAKRELGINNISKVLNGSRKSAGGYKFEYKNKRN
jgi:hypothetical protein